MNSKMAEDEECRDCYSIGLSTGEGSPNDAPCESCNGTGIKPPPDTYLVMCFNADENTGNLPCYKFVAELETQPEYENVLRLAQGYKPDVISVDFESINLVLVKDQD